MSLTLNVQLEQWLTAFSLPAELEGERHHVKEMMQDALSASGQVTQFESEDDLLTCAKKITMKSDNYFSMEELCMLSFMAHQDESTQEYLIQNKPFLQAHIDNLSCYYDGLETKTTLMLSLTAYFSQGMNQLLTQDALYYRTLNCLAGRLHALHQKAHDVKTTSPLMVINFLALKTIMSDLESPDPVEMSTQYYKRGIIGLLFSLMDTKKFQDLKSDVMPSQVLSVLTTIANSSSDIKRNVFLLAAPKLFLKLFESADASTFIHAFPLFLEYVSAPIKRFSETDTAQYIKQKNYNALILSVAGRFNDSMRSTHLRKKAFDRFEHNTLDKLIDQLPQELKGLQSVLKKTSQEMKGDFPEDFNDCGLKMKLIFLSACMRSNSAIPHDLQLKALDQLLSFTDAKKNRQLIRRYGILSSLQTNKTLSSTRDGKVVTTKLLKRIEPQKNTPYKNFFAQEQDKKSANTDEEKKSTGLTSHLKGLTSFSLAMF